MTIRTTILTIITLCVLLAAAAALALPPANPHLTVLEPSLGTWEFLETDGPLVELDVTAGDLLQFSWTADASWYGGIIAGYRYGWDLINPFDAFDPGWATGLEPDLLAAAPRSFAEGTHTFHIWVQDEEGLWTLAGFQLTIVPPVANETVTWSDIKALYDKD